VQAAEEQLGGEEAVLEKNADTVPRRETALAEFARKYAAAPAHVPERDDRIAVGGDEKRPERVLLRAAIDDLTERLSGVHPRGEARSASAVDAWPMDRSVGDMPARM